MKIHNKGQFQNVDYWNGGETDLANLGYQQPQKNTLFPWFRAGDY